MLRVVLGLLKGGLIGAAIGFGAFRLGIEGGALGFVVYALVGLMVGLLVGKPPWRQETIWTSIIKGIFGLLIAMGLYWGGRKLLGGTHLAFATGLGAPDKAVVDIPFLLGPVIGALYGIFVEVDDTGGGSAPAARSSAGAPSRR
jgi:ABC-type arginine transport system permease subunit